MNNLSFTDFFKNIVFDINYPFMSLKNMRNEILILKKRGFEDQYFLKDFYLFIKNEPCFMCTMALTHSRVNRLYFIDSNIFIERNK